MGERQRDGAVTGFLWDSGGTLHSLSASCKHAVQTRSAEPPQIILSSHIACLEPTLIICVSHDGGTSVHRSLSNTTGLSGVIIKEVRTPVVARLDAGYLSHLKLNKKRHRLSL